MENKMEYALSDALTVLWRKMTKATSMADLDADFFEIVDTIIISEKIETEFQRLTSPK